MTKKERILLYSEIEIPEIVQKKADLAFLQIKKSQNERVEDMEQHEIRDMQSIEAERKGKKMKKSLAAAAACAVLIAAAGVGSAGFLGNAAGDQTETNQTEIASNEGTTEDVMTTISKAFALSVKAAESGEKTELTVGTPVAIGVETHAWAIGGYEGGTCEYCINLPLVCEGDNIESVTYSINKGAFQVIEDEDDSIISGGKEYEGSINAGSIGGVYDEVTGKSQSITKYYTEFTLDYDRQESETTWINMCRDGIALSDFDLIWGEDRTLEEMKKGYQELIDGVVITCTVNFSDGTSETAELEPGTILTTARELNLENAVEPDEEDVFFTFERK